MTVASDKMEGESFLSIFRGDIGHVSRSKPIFWEHQGNRAVREGRWKLVHRRSDDDSDDLHCWELYNMDDGRTELTDLASQHSDRVARMAALWWDWASRVGVKTWPLQPIPPGEKDWSNLPWMW